MACISVSTDMLIELLVRVYMSCTAGGARSLARGWAGLGLEQSCNRL